MSWSNPEVAIIGAGPYGLSLAAHLKWLRVDFRIFGEPMGFWSRMHKGMGLKSPDFGTNIYAPRRGFRFVDWCNDRGISTAEPIPIELFTEYGLWAQQHLVPRLEQIEVANVRRHGEGFHLTLTDRTSFLARQVVVATGLSHFARVPDELRNLPSQLVSHTTEHREYSEFEGRSVAVIGAGASALEAGVMLQEVGATAHVLVRGPRVSLGTPKQKRRLRDHILHPDSVLGPGRKNFFLQRVPMATHYMPADRRAHFVKTYLGPSAGGWLRERAERLSIRTLTSVVAATPSHRDVRLKLNERGVESELRVDHVICGTGFEVNLDRLPFLDPTLMTGLRRIEQAPALSRRFESSVPGLYFTGPASALSFGPLFRFVAGAGYAAPLVARHLARHRRRDPIGVVRERAGELA
jgi:cation diffusion facilitator CzcD-associated flavoprotein CzcO